jgi:crotonobetainyl-CoA:carnitine CoA-transferase CaiB-like acyl-CoA transferase
MLGDALKGIRVLDFSQIAAGPLCSMLLADLGAQVIKVEPPGGDLGRTLGPAWIGEDSALFHAFNRGKQGICLDLKHVEGVDIARTLAAQADVVLESMRPGVMARLGLGYEQLRQDHPSLVYCSISAYGQAGPYAQRAGVDGILQADSGLMSLIGVPGAEPCKVQTPVVDVITGHIACTAIVTKLLQRARDGEGGHLDVNLLNSAIALQLPSIASYLNDGILPERIGSAAPYSAPNEAFQTSDGWIMVAAYMGDRWKRLCDAIGRDDLVTDTRFATSRARTANRSAMREALNATFRARTTQEWLAILQEADILCAAVAGYDDLVQHPQVTCNHMLTTVDVPHHGPVRLPGFPVNSAEENARPRSPAPTLGQHTRELLGSCAMGEARLDALFSAGVIR